MPPQITPKRENRYRVAHLHNSEGVYGAEHWTLTLAKYLADTDIDTLVITIGNKPNSDEFFKRLVDAGIPAVHLPIPGRFNLRLIIKIRRLLIQKKIQILHTHGFKSDVMGYFSTRGLTIALVSTPHGWCAEENWLIRIYEAIGRFFLRRFDKVFPLSPALFENLISRGFARKRLCMILNAVDTAGFDLMFSRRSWRQTNDPLHVLFVGRLRTTKGIMELVEGFSKARLTKGSLLYIVGDGIERSGLEARCRSLGILDQVRILGELENVAPIYAKSDVLVLPSYSEGVPRVIMEAFASGVPVIGTDIYGIRQLITPNKTGFLVPVANAEAIARCLERIDQTPEWAQAMAINARELIIQKFSGGRQALTFAKEYKALVGL
ncbi:MAG: glycosyltransferase [Pseudomonadota bacterium]